MIDEDLTEALRESSRKQREEMRDERRKRVFGADESSRGAGVTSGPTGENFRGHSTGIDSNGQFVGGDDTIAENSSKRVGQNNRRFKRYSVGTPERSSQDTVPFGLEAVDSPTRPVGRPRKIEDVTIGIKKTFFPKKTPLSEKEAKAMEDTLPRCLQSYGEYLDQVIHWKSQVETPADIWGDLTDMEARCLSNILLRKARNSGHVADVVRNITNGEDYVAVGVMMVPRVMKTVEELRKTPVKRGKR